MLSKEHIYMFVIVVVAVIAAAWISGKLKLNSYESYYEENFDDADYHEVEYPAYRRAA